MPNDKGTPLPGLFIGELGRRPRRRMGWRLARWISMGLLPVVGTCSQDLSDLLCRLSAAIGLVPGCATTLAVGEEG
ncbi:MAG: hypothetical protein HZA51_05625 [Planctomycetes bacterium]|nr:hypothetical protein [Planctomycetota bacterium]